MPTSYCSSTATKSTTLTRRTRARRKSSSANSVTAPSARCDWPSSANTRASKHWRSRALTKSMRPIQARISIGAMAHNLRVARSHAGAARVFAVVKANAYGHGLSRARRALAAADGYAVLTLEEAANLRLMGVDQPILLLEGFFGADEIATCAELDLWPVLHHAAHVARARSLSAVAGITLMTHFAQADETAGVDWQLHPFLRELSAYGLPWSSANSAALLRYPETHGAWARPGLMLYGASPFADLSAEQLGLRPAMTLQ